MIMSREELSFQYYFSTQQEMMAKIQFENFFEWILSYS